MPVIVQKYGGSSLATPDLIKSVASRICSAHDSGNSVVATVSAMGDSTDDLISIASQVSVMPDLRELDVLLSTGELQSCALVAMALKDMGKNAVSLSGAQAGIRTDSSYGKAKIADIDTLPFPEREKLWGIDQAKKSEVDVSYIVTIRGCPYKCTYCASPFHWKRNKTEFRSPQSVLDEMKYLHDNYWTDNRIDYSASANMDSKENLIIKELSPREKFMSIIKKMAKIVRSNKNLYGFLFTAPNHIHDESKQVWKTYQERLYAILKSIIEEGINRKEFINLDPGMLMKAIGGLFHGLLIENEDDLNEKEFELMLKNFLRPE